MTNRPKKCVDPHTEGVGSHCRCLGPGVCCETDTHCRQRGKRLSERRYDSIRRRRKAAASKKR